MNPEACSGKAAEDGSGKISPATLNCPGDSPPSATTALQATRIILTDENLDSVSLEDLRSHWRHQDIYINSLETLNSTHEGQCAVLRESEEKLKQQLGELALRERVLVRRLATKEQDMQEYASQLSEMKSGQAPTIGGLRSALLDPAVNILLQKLRQELAATRTRLDDTQNELAAWKFTPDSNTGKRLMAKCRLLYQENEELGRMVSNGRLAKLEGDLALQKSFSEEVKKSQSELDELLQDLDEDVEGMQSTIYYLQQELRKAKEAVTNLEQENAALRNIESRPKSPSPTTPTATTTPPAINGLSVVAHHNGKWCKSDETNNRTNNNNNNNDDDNKNESSSAGGGVDDDDDRLSESGEAGSEKDDSVVTTKKPEELAPPLLDRAKRTPSENGDEPPIKKIRPEPNYADELVVVTTNGDVSGQ